MARAPGRAAPEALADCRRSLALAGGVLDAQLAATEGTPAPFPPDLAPQYTAAGFEAAVRAAVAECAPETLHLLQVDCSEYPCVALFSQPARTYNHGVGRLAGCEGWSARFVGSESGNGSFQTDDGPAEFSVIAGLPHRRGLEKDAQVRWRARYAAARDSAMDAAGGREPTPIEEVDRQLEFWEDARDDGLGDPAELDAKLAALREERAALAAAP